MPGDGDNTVCRSRNESSSMWSIKPLTCRDGYGIWKFKIRMLLVHDNLWKCIEGYPEGDNTNIYVKARIYEMAMSKICLTLDGAAITHVRRCTTAKSWKSLADASEDKGKGRRLSLERKLYRCSLIDFDNIEFYINAVTSIAQDLADVGKNIEDASLAAILLEGLTSHYEPLVMALENLNVEITSDLVKSKLLNELSKTSSDIEQAVALRTKSNPKQKSRKSKPIVCYECNEPVTNDLTVH